MVHNQLRFLAKSADLCMHKQGNIKQKKGGPLPQCISEIVMARTLCQFLMSNFNRGDEFEENGSKRCCKNYMKPEKDAL